MTNYSLKTVVKSAIFKAGGQKTVALGLGISDAELSRKVSGERGFRIQEFQKFLDSLGLIITERQSGDTRRLIGLLSKKLSEVLEDSFDGKEDGSDRALIQLLTQRLAEKELTDE